MIDLQGIGMTSQRTRDRMVARLIEQGISNSQILEIMRNTPRHIFVDEALASRAYEDTSLPIGYNQTISQPYIVAKMTELMLEFGPLKKVLEIGTGCGYQTAILAPFVEKIYSVERILPLQRRAKNCLWQVKVKNVSYQHSDGGWGWPEYAPFDGIIVTAAPQIIPQALLQQLAVGGIMVIPVGNENAQKLHRVIRRDNDFVIEELEPVIFVPFLTGKESDI